MSAMYSCAAVELRTGRGAGSTALCVMTWAPDLSACSWQSAVVKTLAFQTENTTPLAGWRNRQVSSGRSFCGSGVNYFLDKTNICSRYTYESSNNTHYDLAKTYK